MEKVYIVWAITGNYHKVHRICTTIEKAEEERVQFLRHIPLIREAYKRQFGTEYKAEDSVTVELGQYSWI